MAKNPKDPNKASTTPKEGKGKSKDATPDPNKINTPDEVKKNEGESTTQTPNESVTIPSNETPQEEPKGNVSPKEDVRGVAMMANMPAPNVVIGVTALKEVVVLKTVEDLGRVPVITMTDEVRKDLTPSTLTYAIAKIEVKKEMERVKGSVHITQLLYAHEL